MTTDNDDLELLRPGMEVGGRYLIERLLGRGGFSYVYLARHLSIETLRVAIKVMRADLAEAESARRRFVREGEAVASLSSPHVVKVSDAGLLPDNRPYLVLEFCDGNTLDHLLEQRGRINPIDVARFARQILLALEEAHRVGIVHRDLKPENVFVVRDTHTGERVLKVGDFGIARVSDGRGAAPARMTMSGGIVCTPAYASPELLEGDAVPASDLYALGHMMAELIEGYAPYAHVGQALVVCAEHLRPAPVPLGPQTRRSALRAIIERAVAKPLTERFSSARQMREAIDAALAEWPSDALAAAVEPDATDPRSLLSSGGDDTMLAPGGLGRPSGGHDTAFAATVDIAQAGATPATAQPIARARRGVLMPALVAAAVLASAGVGLAVVSGASDDAVESSGSASPSPAAARPERSPTDDAEGSQFPAMGSAAGITDLDAMVGSGASERGSANTGSGSHAAETGTTPAQIPDAAMAAPRSPAADERSAASDPGRPSPATSRTERSARTEPETPSPAPTAETASPSDAPTPASGVAGDAQPTEPSANDPHTDRPTPPATEGTGSASPFNNIRVR